MVKYKIVESEDKENEEVIIEKTGQVYHFSVSDARRNLENLKKVLKELTAQKELEDAKMVNIEEHNEIIKILTPEQMHAVNMYYSAKEISTVCDKKSKEIVDTIEQIEEEAKEILKQTGITL